MSFTDALFLVIILIVSTVFHELAHGTVADMLGDPTPRLSGRLTLNPLAHMELFGSFILPIMCIVLNSSFVIGWAKPVPFNVSHLKYKRWGPALVAIAGPLVNIVIAVLGAIAYHVANNGGAGALVHILYLIVVLNVSLAVFNLVPVPPLDGHHIVGAVFPAYERWSRSLMQTYRFAIMILVIFAFGSLIAPVIGGITNLLLS